MSEHFHAKSQFDGSKLTRTDGPTPFSPSYKYSVAPHCGQKLYGAVVAKPQPREAHRYSARSPFPSSISVSPGGSCVSTTTTIGESRPAVMRRHDRTAAGRFRRQGIAASLSVNLKAGRGGAQSPSGLFFRLQTREANMTRRAQKGRSADPRQTDFLSLLEGAVALPPAPERRRDAGALDLDQRLRRLLNDAIAAGPFANREALAEAVSFHAGRRVTKAMIDSWTGASRPHALPAHLVPAFCAALGNSVLLQGLAEASGCAVTESADLVRSRLDRLALFIRFAKAEQRRLIGSLPLFRGGRP